MTPPVLPSSAPKLRLKPDGSWFAAGASFRQALDRLSDGAFKLFAYLCLQAERPSGRLTASQPQLAQALGKSKRAIGHYVTELQTQGLCRVEAAKNQHGATRFEISEAYWPYQRSELPQRGLGGESQPPSAAPDSPAPSDYVASVRECFLGLGCSNGRFNAAQQALARQFEQRGIPLEQLEDAMALGAYRKYVSWLNGQASEPIASLRYFEPLLEELQRQLVPKGYLQYLRHRLPQLAEKCLRQRAASAHSPALAGAKK